MASRKQNHRSTCIYGVDILTDAHRSTCIYGVDILTEPSLYMYLWC